ncbi:MAG TPA: hypothetical protein VGE07_12145, partial [Herpetosiphonaceae bacterium]
DDCWRAKEHAPPLSVHEPRLRRLAAALPAEGAAVLLAHEPDIADLAAGTPFAPGRFDLQLSGHSHGGQVRLPALGAPILPPYGQKYPAGLYQIGRLQLYTCRGVGSPRRIRFNCRPELAMLTLRAG